MNEQAVLFIATEGPLTGAFRFFGEDEWLAWQRQHALPLLNLVQSRDGYLAIRLAALPAHEHGFWLFRQGEPGLYLGWQERVDVESEHDFHRYPLYAKDGIGYLRCSFVGDIRGVLAQRKAPSRNPEAH